jgi:hypothetical protein
MVFYGTSSMRVMTYPGTPSNVPGGSSNSRSFNTPQPPCCEGRKRQRRRLREGGEGDGRGGGRGGEGARKRGEGNEEEER